MRNLEVTRCVVLPSNPLLSRCSWFCLDCDSGSVWVATKDGLCCIAEKEVSLIPLVEDGHITPDDSAVGVEYISDLESVCLAMRNGDVLLCNTHTHQYYAGEGLVKLSLAMMYSGRWVDVWRSGTFPEKLQAVLATFLGLRKLLYSCAEGMCHSSTCQPNIQVECVGSVSGGLLCMGWSPEQDLAVFVTGEENLLVMTREFDPISETPAHPEEFGEAKPVTVGWGKKSTQFHGSVGKPKADQLKEKPLSLALPWDDRKPRISWRGDGEYFVCSTIDPHTGVRRLRVWSRECVLHSTSETLDGIEQPLHWRPSGNLIASTQRKPHKHDVIFFERNGLQHGEFTLEEGGEGRGGKVHVHELQWSCDSTVLALWLETREQPEEREQEKGEDGGRLSESYVQLWSMGNYHWYLKQELHLPSPVLAGMQWDPVSPLTLHLLTLDGQYLCYSWRWVVAESQAHRAENTATVAVIDGAHILLTPFRHAIVPPPMCIHELSLPSPVLQIAFAPPPHCNDFLALLTSGEVAMFCYSTPHSREGETAQEHIPELAGISRLGGAPFCLHSLRQLVWWQGARLLGVVSEGEGEAVVELSLQVDRASHHVKVNTCHTTTSPGPLLSLTTNPDTQTAIVQLTNGTILRYADGSLVPWQLPSGQELQFPEQACDHLSLATFNGQEHVIGLSESRRILYIDDRKLASGCTSFAVHDEFLLFTTTSHTCRLLPLHCDPSELSPLDVDRPNALDETVRRVERGSRIVTAIPCDVRVVLQMPRGNLETICPRALVLSSVRGSLDQLRFKDAFVMLRKHRINLNLIHDHNPQAFLAHTREFVRQLDSVSYINLFLTELRDENVTQTMYPGLGKSHGTSEEGRREEMEGGGERKVDHVCDAVREALMELGENKYLLSIITTHIKKTDPELETVLQKVKELKEHPPEGQGESPLVTAEDALKYSLFLVDVNQLYDVALGMYDFSLVLMVAEKSQKDPKEYLPFLSELRKLPLHYQRYRIDRHLRRYSKALKHISKCGPEKFEECMGLVCEYSLYTDALNIYTDRSSPEYKAIARAYGGYLADNSKHRAAGIMFAQCECLCEAMASFERAGCWQQVFSLSAQLCQGPAERMEVARRVAGSLKAGRHWCAAATVLMDYAEDVEEAVVTLLEGGVWEEALRIAYLHRRADLIETHLKPSLVEAHQSQLSGIETLQGTFVQHANRLAVIRENKQKKQAAILEGTYAADERDADLFSDTSSITGHSTVSSVGSSLATKTSGRSSKNRRKAERKRHSLREGSAYEDVALLEALGETVGTIDKMQDEISSLLGMLVQYGFSFEARTVQTRFSELLATVKSRLPSIWQPPTIPSLTSTQRLTGPDSTVSSIVAAMAASSPTPQDIVSPAGTTVPIPQQPKLRNIPWKLDILS